MGENMKEAFDAHGNQIYVGCEVTCIPGKEEEDIVGTDTKIGSLAVGEVTEINSNVRFVRVSAVEVNYGFPWIWWVSTEQLEVMGVTGTFNRDAFNKMLGI